jgi:hypothetical protein
MHFKSLWASAAVRCVVVFGCVGLYACSYDGLASEDCVHNLLDIPASGTSDYVLRSDETGCDDFAHSDEVLLYLVKRGETRRIPVFEYIPSAFHDKPHATWLSPVKLRIDFKEIDAILMTYKVDEAQVDIRLAKPPSD